MSYYIGIWHLYFHSFFIIIPICNTCFSVLMYAFYFKTIAILFGQFQTVTIQIFSENIFLTVQDRIRILVCELFVNWECGLLFFPVLQPCVWESSWIDQEIWAYVLQAVLPKQCQGNWLHQGKYLDPLVSIDFKFSELF